MPTLPNSRVPQAKPLEDETYEPLGEEGYSPACVGRMGRSRDQWLPVRSTNAQFSASYPALPGTQHLIPGCSGSAGIDRLTAIPSGTHPFLVCSLRHHASDFHIPAFC